MKSYRLWRERTAPAALLFRLRRRVRRSQVVKRMNRYSKRYFKRGKTSSSVRSSLSWNSVLRIHRSGVNWLNTNVKLVATGKRFDVTDSLETGELASTQPSVSEYSDLDYVNCETPQKSPLQPLILWGKSLKYFSPLSISVPQNSVGYSIVGTDEHYYQNDLVFQNVLSQKWWKLKSNSLKPLTARKGNGPQPPIEPIRPEKHYFPEPIKPDTGSIAELAKYEEDCRTYQETKNKNYLIEGLYQTDLGEYKRRYSAYESSKEFYENNRNQDLKIQDNLKYLEYGSLLSSSLEATVPEFSPLFRETFAGWVSHWQSKQLRLLNSAARFSRTFLPQNGLTGTNIWRSQKTYPQKELKNAYTLGLTLKMAKSRVRTLWSHQTTPMMAKATLSRYVNRNLTPPLRLSDSDKNSYELVPVRTSLTTTFNGAPIPLSTSLLLSLWTNKRILKFALFFNNLYSVSKSELSVNRLILTTCRVIQNQLLAYCFGSQLTSLRKSNVWTTPYSKHFLRKRLLYSAMQTVFQVDIGTWAHKCVIQFAENVSGRKVHLHIGPFVQNSLTVDDHARAHLYQSRSVGFRKLLGHRIFMKEALTVVMASLRLKDPNLLSNWICAMVGRMNFWKFRVLFRYLKFLIQHLFRFEFPAYQFKCFKLRLKGKISVGGNSRSRILFFRAGDTSHSKTDNRIAYHLNYIYTFTGVMGLKLWFFY